MAGPDGTPLTAALTGEAPTRHSRWLGPADEAAMQALLRARYGETYSYRDLYAPGVLAARWRSGALASLGELDDEGRLVAHTGLLLHAGRDHAESVMSLIHPRLRTAMSRDEHAEMWRRVLAGLAACGYHWLHQHTSTLHPAAQRYARRYMRAAPIGLVIDYTAGETLIGIAGSDAPMQALAMTTPLRPRPEPGPRHLPAGPWFAWLRERFAGLDAAPAVAVEPRAGDDMVFGPCDSNPALGLVRRAVVGLGAAGERGAPARVDLVHVPVTDPALVAGASARLLADGYLPVGVRPCLRGDEVVWQRLPDRAAARAAAGRAVPAGDAHRALFDGWISRCGPTS